MKISKKRKKELRRIYDEKIGREYVRWVENQPTYTSFEWVEYMSENQN